MNSKPSLKQEADWCRDALACQNACNLGGLAHSWSRLTEAMSQAGLSTSAICDHPACILYSAKAADLCGLNYHYPSAAETKANALIRMSESVEGMATKAGNGQ
jgi:hypothetical protein